MLRIDGLYIDGVGEYEPELEVGDYQEGDPVEVGDFWGTMQHALSVGGTVLTNRYIAKGNKATGIVGRLETMPSATPLPIPSAPSLVRQSNAGVNSKLLLLGGAAILALYLLRR